ncbi:hypothetical protein UB51_11315 [Paenibacillus sp. IHBB 10380]|nr:hypothetical protein UB51_11315 [Paenibacillus sp. IHBB 10380]
MTYYEIQLLNKDEKFGLMALIVSSYDDSLSKGNASDEVWNKIKHYLIKDFTIHQNTIFYWALVDEELEDCFFITPLLRDVLEYKNT